jgi:hypothetical protein
VNPSKGTLALINAGLAQGKGRSGLLWFLLSLLIGPIATFLIVILDRVPLRGRRVLRGSHELRATTSH